MMRRMRLSMIAVAALAVLLLAAACGGGGNAAEPMPEMEMEPAAAVMEPEVEKAPDADEASAEPEMAAEEEQQEEEAASGNGSEVEGATASEDAGDGEGDAAEEVAGDGDAVMTAPDMEVMTVDAEDEGGTAEEADASEEGGDAEEPMEAEEVAPAAVVRQPTQPSGSVGSSAGVMTPEVDPEEAERQRLAEEAAREAAEAEKQRLADIMRVEQEAARAAGIAAAIEDERRKQQEAAAEEARKQREAVEAAKRAKEERQRLAAEAEKRRMEEEAAERRRMEEEANRQPVVGPAVGNLAPDFTLPNANGGGSVSLSSYSGNPVVVVFYRSFYCYYCKQQIDEFRSNYEQLSNAGIDVVAISSDKLGDFGSTIAAENYQFPILYTSLQEAVPRSYDRFGHVPDGGYQGGAELADPGVFLIDGEGKIVWRDLGTSIGHFVSVNRVIAQADSNGL